MTADIATKIDNFFTQYPKRSYPKGQILVFAEESPEHIFYMVAGKVRQYAISYRDDEVIVNIFKAPAFFPMSWAINRTTNHYFYKTETESKLHIAPPDDALKFLEANPDVALDLLSRVYHGAEGLMGRLVHLMSGTARSRLIYELIVEARRFGKLNDAASYELSLSEVDLAARSGLSRETVNRAMRRLKDQKLVSVTDNVIKISNLDDLQKALGADI
jgi:CRP-like cAMP-binding protein